MNATAYRFLIVDDHPIVRRGLSDFLHDLYPAATLAEAVDGEQALALGLEQAWDLVILDMSLPRLHGVEVLKRLHQARPHLRILVFTMQASVPFALSCLRLGAAGYLVKESATEELEDALRLILLGESYVSQRLGRLNLLD